MVSLQGTSKLKRQDAPEELELVRRFINTWDAEFGTDALATAGNAAEWMAGESLIDGPVGLTEAGRERAVQIRETLRALARLNGHGQVGPGVLEQLNEAADQARFCLRFTADGEIKISSGATDVASRAIGRILAIVAVAFVDGTWKRMRICRAEDCGWAFYDRSRNRSGVWCQMAECGNRSKVRTHRERAREAAPRPSKR
jgi:predicted RNA-binding Zn ribbon-like protein